jgi:hypothetical protein
MIRIVIYALHYVDYYYGDEIKNDDRGIAWIEEI